MDKAFIKNPVEAYEKLKEENKSLKESLKLISQTLNHTLQSEVDLYKRQIDNSVPDDWEYEEVLALVEEYIEKLKAENEQYKKVISKLAGKTIAITTYDTPIEFCDHKDITIQQLKAENEIYKKMLEDEEVILALNEVRTGERHLWFNKAEKYKQTLTEIKEIAEEDCKQCFEIDGFSKPDDCGICPYNKILQKISEVINEN